MSTEFPHNHEILFPESRVWAQVYYRAHNNLWQPALNMQAEPLVISGVITNNIIGETITILPDSGNKAIEDDAHFSLNPITLPTDVFIRNGVEYFINFTSHLDTLKD